MPKNNVVVLITGKDDTQSAFQAVQQNLNKMGEKAQETQEKVHSLGMSFGPFFEAEFAVHAVLNGLSRLKEMVEQVGQVSERLNIMHESTGIGTQELTAFAAQAHVSGVSLDQVGRSLTHMEKALADARDGLIQDKRAFADLGINVKELTAQHATMDQVLEKVADGFHKINDPASRAQAAMALFGRAGAQLLPILEEGSAGMRDMIDRLHKLGVDTSPQAVANLSLLDRQMRMLEIGVEGVAAAFVQSLEPSLEAVGTASQYFTGAIGNMDKAAGAAAGRGLRQLLAIIEELAHFERQALYEAESWAHGFDLLENRMLQYTGLTAKARAMAKAGMASDIADQKAMIAASAAENEQYAKSIYALAHPKALKAPIGNEVFHLTDPGQQKAGRAGRAGKALPDLQHQADAFAAIQKKYADDYDMQIYRMQQTYRSFLGFNVGEDRRAYAEKMKIMDHYFAAMKQHVDPAFDPVSAPGTSALHDRVKSITDAITEASTATESFARAWEHAGLQIAKIFADAAVQRWGPKDPSLSVPAGSPGSAAATIAGALGGGMPAPAGVKAPQAHGIGSLFKGALGMLTGSKSAGGSGGVTVNLYNQGSPQTVTKTHASSSGASGSGMEAMLEKKVVSIFLKDATSNGPIWQAIGSAVSG